MPATRAVIEMSVPGVLRLPLDRDLGIVPGASVVVEPCSEGIVVSLAEDGFEPNVPGVFQTAAIGPHGEISVDIAILNNSGWVEGDRLVVDRALDSMLILFERPGHLASDWSHRALSRQGQVMTDEEFTAYLLAPRSPELADAS